MPNSIVRLLSECHADTALIRFLIPDPTISIHCEGCTEVANIIMLPKNWTGGISENTLP